MSPDLKMFSVYVLQSTSTGKLYIGQSANLDRRIKEHTDGLARYTRGRGPWKVVLLEEYHTRAEAMRREKALKSGQGRAWLKAWLSSSA